MKFQLIFLKVNKSNEGLTQSLQYNDIYLMQISLLTSLINSNLNYHSRIPWTLKSVAAIKHKPYSFSPMLPIAI